MLCSRRIKSSLRCTERNRFDACTGELEARSRRDIACEGSVLFEGLPCSLKLRGMLTE